MRESLNLELNLVQFQVLRLWLLCDNRQKLGRLGVKFSLTQVVNNCYSVSQRNFVELFELMLGYSLLLLLLIGILLQCLNVVESSRIYVVVVYSLAAFPISATAVLLLDLFLDGLSKLLPGKVKWVFALEILLK